MSTHALTPEVTEQVDRSRPGADAIDVYCWRVETLEQAGYTGAFAHMLAEDTDIDLHRACNLIAHGCPQPTAYRILA
jgi:hypothetical protein